MSDLEEHLLRDMRACLLPEPAREFVFAKPRRFRFDFAWPKLKLAVEVNGGTWINGRHSYGTGASKDCEKDNLAGMLGWLVLHFTGDMIRDGKAIGVIEQAIEQREGEEEDA